MSTAVLRGVLAPLAIAALVQGLAGCVNLLTASVEKLEFGGVPRTACTFAETELVECTVSAALSGCFFTEDKKGKCEGLSCDPGACPKSKPAGLLAGVTGFGPIAPKAGGVISAGERNALLAIFNATGGSTTWYTKTGWGEAAGTECSWYGVTCNEAGTKVIGLEFDFNNLTGTLPPEIAGLKNLTRLYLDEFYLGPLPSKIGNLSKLEELHLLSMYSVTGLPTTIGNLGALKILAIDGMDSLSSLPTSLGKLKALEQLELTDLQALHSLPAQLSGLTALQLLHISEVPLDAFPAFVPQLPALRTLAIHTVPSLVGELPPGLGNLANLELLFLEDTGISGSIPVQLGNLAKLKVLLLRFNPSLSGPIPAELGNIATLQGLILPGNALSGKIPASLGNLSHLQSLNLALNQLSGNIPSTLRNLGDLRLLYLAGNQLTGNIPNFGNLANLSVVMLGANQFNGPLPAGIGQLPNLEILFMRKAGLTGPLPDLGTATLLTHVNLSENAFDAGGVPGWVKTLPSLQSIGLNDTHRTGNIPNLSPLASRLVYLGLADNDFKVGQVPAWIASMTQLKGLNLAGSRRKGALPDFLGGLTQLGALDVSRNNFDAGPIPDFVNKTNFPALEQLVLSKTNRTGAIPAAIWDLYLSDLRLADNHLTGPLSEDVSKPLLNLLDISRNAMDGPLPEGLGTQVRMASLNLSGNKFSGEIPLFYKSSMLDEDMFDGSDTDPFGEKFVGADFRFNRLTSVDPETIAILQQKHENGEDFRLTQTVPPTNVKAKAKSSSVVHLTWTPIDFLGNGRYVIAISLDRSGPFTDVKSVSPKSAHEADVGTLNPGTKFFFRIRTESAKSAQNPNVLLSAPSAVVAATTK